jgi:peroxiredoxin
LRIVAASVDSPEDTARMRRAVIDADTGEATDPDAITFLSDPEGRLLDLLGMRHEGAGPGGSDIAQSSSYLLEPDGTLLWHHVTPNYRVRPEPETILAAYDAAKARSSSTP